MNPDEKEKMISHFLAYDPFFVFWDDMIRLTARTFLRTYDVWYSCTSFADDSRWRHFV